MVCGVHSSMSHRLLGHSRPVDIDEIKAAVKEAAHDLFESEAFEKAVIENLNARKCAGGGFIDRGAQGLVITVYKEAEPNSTPPPPDRIGICTIPEVHITTGSKNQNFSNAPSGTTTGYEAVK